MTKKKAPKQIDLFTDPMFEHDIRKNEKSELRNSSPRKGCVTERRPLPPRKREGPHR